MDEREKIPSWPGWETVRVIGRGSVGTVYEIRRDVFGDTERCALKHLTIPHEDTELYEMRSAGMDEQSIALRLEERAKSVLTEYKMMVRLNDCPYVVTCHDVNCVRWSRGPGWDIDIRMELLTPLVELLAQRMDWPEEEELIHLGRDIAKALVACRALNIVHRDVKPQNLFRAEDGSYKLGDFGIARIASLTGSATGKKGTFSYMAPEVYNFEHYGPAADLYSLGMVLYWLLNGRRVPFAAENTPWERERALRRRMKGEPIPPPTHGSPALQRIVLKACAFDLKDRYQSAEELLRDLEELGAESREPVKPLWEPEIKTIGVQRGPNREAEKRCPACGRVLPAGRDDCPGCGYSELYPDRDERGRWGKWKQDLQHCPACGEFYLQDDVFCSHCGRKRDGMPGRFFAVSPKAMESPQGPMPTTLLYDCRNCGNHWTGSSWKRQNYCPRCGNRVSGREEQRQKSPPPAKQPGSKRAKKPGGAAPAVKLTFTRVEDDMRRERERKEAEAEKARKRKKRRVLWICLAVAAVLILGAAVLLRHKGTELQAAYERALTLWDMAAAPDAASPGDWTPPFP